MTRPAIAKRILITVAAIMASSPAFADAIDGDWCFTTEARHLRIEGSSITTPAGTKTTGDYYRHAFTYIVPDGEPGAGEPVALQMLNEEEVEVSVNGGTAQVWRRCELTS